MGAGIPIVDEDAFVRTVSFSGPNDNNEDIEVTLELDQAALDAYNDQQVDGPDGEGLHGPTYEILPEDHYDIESLELTIPKGRKQLSCISKCILSLFDLSKKYALPLKLYLHQKEFLVSTSASESSQW